MNPIDITKITPPSVPDPLNFRPWLAQEIRERNIPLPSTASPAEVIPWVKKAIKRHKEIGTVIPENTDSYPAWKRLMQDWQDFLQQLEHLQKAPAPTPTSTQNPDKTPDTLPNQQHPTRTKPGQTRTEPDKTLPTPEQAPVAPGQTQPPPAVPSNQKSSTPFAAPSLPPSEPEPSKDELEYDDLIDGFTSDKERLAVARVELQDHLANRPVRIGKLAAPQQAAVFTLIEEGGFSVRAVAKLLSEPPPTGLGFRISKSTVAAWHKKYKSNFIKEQQRRATEAKLRSALEVIDNPTDPDAAFQTAAQRILKLRILTSDDAPIDHLDQLVKTLTTLRKQALAERKQVHLEQTQ